MRSGCTAVAVLVCAATLLGAPAGAVRRLDGTHLSRAGVDAIVTRLMKAADVSGVGLTVFNDGKVAYSNAYGLRDTERTLPLTEDSVLGAASLTKVAFAYLVMQLVEEHALDLDTPVQQYLPKPLEEYAEYRDLAGDPRRLRITPRMLLSHTAGFPNWRWFTEDRRLHIAFEPGARYAYSGEGLQLLQLVVETIGKAPLQDLMQRRVFGPLGMRRTSMVTEARFEDDYAIGYDEWGRALGHQHRANAQAAGSMQTTLRDFTAFLQAVMDGRNLAPATRELMFSPQIRITSKHQFPSLSPETTGANDAIRLSYGLGWGLYWSDHGRAFFKEGHDAGFRHYTVTFSSPRDGLLIMTNSSNGEGIFKELLETVLGNRSTPIEWEGFTPYGELPPRTPLPRHAETVVDPARLDRLAGTYIYSPDLVLTVARTGNHLTLRENEEAPGDLFAESPLSFFSKTSDDVVTFELDEAGRVVRLVLHVDGRTVPVDRVK